VNQVYISIYPLAPRTLIDEKNELIFVKIQFHLLWEHLNDIASIELRFHWLEIQFN
jgi:hypothetical protein